MGSGPSLLNHFLDTLLEIALEVGHATYDCDYLALAVLERAEFFTADARLYRRRNCSGAERGEKGRADEDPAQGVKDGEPLFA